MSLTQVRQAQGLWLFEDFSARREGGSGQHVALRQLGALSSSSPVEGASCHPQLA